MKNKKLLTVLLSTMLVFTSTASVFAGETKSNSNERKDVSSKNYIKEKDSNENEGNDNTFKDCNLGRVLQAAKVVSASKAEIEVKASTTSKDYNLGKGVNIGSAIRNAQEKAKEIVKEPVKETPPKVETPAKVEISQAVKDQIKAEYTAMRATEVTNKAIFVSAIDKKNQVISYIYKVAEGKITYTDAQLTQLDTLSVTFEADIKALTDATVSIKNAEALVKASAQSKSYDAVLAGLKVEAEARVTRGAALTKVSQDLDAFLLVLVEGQAVLPTPITPATEPAVIPAQ